MIFTVHPNSAEGAFKRLPIAVGPRNVHRSIGPMFSNGIRMGRARAFNVPVNDMASAKRFYEDVFDREISPIPGSGGEHHHARTSSSDACGEPLEKGAINGGLFLKSTNGIDDVFLEIEVDDLDGMISKAVSIGGKLVKEKGPLLDIVQFAIVQDLDGNCIGLIELNR
ncbi:MAG: hypothetical protein LLG16_06370 [Euryarchaeota archaeon]|nr:hypothetical protein [Euryarchaeota archaeon]